MKANIMNRMRKYFIYFTSSWSLTRLSCGCTLCTYRCDRNISLKADIPPLKFSQNSLLLLSQMLSDII